MACIPPRRRDRPGRFERFPIQEDTHLLEVMRYVERNPIARKSWSSGRELAFVEPWGDWCWLIGHSAKPSDWVERVNQPETAAALEALHCSVRRGSPFGEANWVANTARALLERTLRLQGWPAAPNKEPDVRPA